MDPITIAAVLLLSAGAWKGLNAATGGLLSAEVGGGVRGAGSYVRTAGSRRVRDARTAARQERMKTPLGRAMQFVLDEVGAVGRGLVRGWRSGRRSGRTAWEERRGDEPMPIVKAWRSGWSWIDGHLNRPNDDPNGSDPEHPNGAPEPEWAPWFDPNETDPNGAPEPEWAPWFDPNGAPEPEREPKRGGKPWAHVRDDGCLHISGWVTEDGMRWPRYCGEPRESEWVLCPEHLAAVRADPDYPQEDIDEYREQDQPLSPDAYRGGPVPNDDPEEDATPNPNETSSPPNHWQDVVPGTGRGPNGQTVTPTRTEGPATMADINSAPAAIALFEAFRGRFEEPESLLTALRDEVAAAADSMGDFAIGGEGDLSAGLQSAVEGVVQAREALDAYLSALHLEYDASIEAAAGKNADAHSIMQEV